MNSNKLYKLLVIVIVTLTINTGFSQGLPFCPTITATSPSLTVCQGGCTTLSANVVAVNQTNTYSVQSIPYVPFSYTGGTNVSLGTDDIWSPVINLGFNFCYFGNIYTSCILGSNGQLSFNTTLASGYDNWSISAAIPSLADMPGNTICAAFRDIDPSISGNMRYYFSGTSPCRALVIYWDNIPLYSCGTPNSTFQLVLYENTNYIDVYLQNSSNSCSWQGGKGIIGIQNANATVAYWPPSRNFPSNWTATNEAWRFVPTGPQSYTVTWAGPTGIIGTGLTQTVCPTSTTNYTATMNVTSCAGVNSTYSTTVNVPVSAAPPPVLATNITQASCSTSSNSANVSISSGSPGYTVNWSPAATLSGSTSTTYSVTNLSVGINTVLVTDASGCKGTATINVNPAPPIPSFSISTPSGTMVGCSPATISLVAVNTNSTLTNMSYTWTSIATGTQTGNTINGSAPSGTNTYTVFGQDPIAGSCIVTQTIAISQNTAVPQITVTPTSRTLTCGGAPACFTAVCNPTTNIQGQWFDASMTPIGGITNSPILMCTGTPGTYSVCFTNITNNCVACQSVAVTANTIVPTMTVNSLQGNTITCTNPCLQFNITASPGPAPKSYSWTNVTTSVTTNPATGGYTICTPGNYVAEYKDGNGCQISQTITIQIDTLRPTPVSATNLPSNSYTLSCYQPSLVATGYSNPLLPAINYSWTVPPNLTISTNTIVINTVSVTANPTTFTVLAKGNNGCVGKQKVLFYKDVIVPPYSAIFTPSALSCSNPSVAMSPQSTSSSTIPVTFTFTSPAPTTTANASGSLFDIPGTYTMAYQNTINGCTATTTTIVPINVTPPSTVALSPVNIPCGSTTVGINAGLVSQLPSYIYQWKPPIGAGMSCAACYSTSTNMTGNYLVIITNTVNGCIATNSVAVSAGSLTVNFTADPIEGFSPLSVNFTNNTSPFSVGTGSITTTWSYGNGITYSVTNSNSAGSPNGSTIYQSAGNYTVLLVVNQSVYSGTTVIASCIGTATQVIKVELPSELIIPNIFTPNGDGVNDVFMIQSTSLTNISVQIFDRWGVKMYDMSSEKNQVGWDGKNLAGKEVPAGAYFYMLKAEGKDGTAFEKQGTVNLYR
jgi:gliding motility-associated-like protein